MKIFKYKLEIVVFICGAVVMIFELVGSRILGPYFGTSIFIWTSLIGIIMGSLSLGYYFGGKIADRNPSYNNLSLIIFSAGIFVLITMITKDFLLVFSKDLFIDIKISSFFISLILFLPPSVLLGMVSPYAVKLRMNNLETSASTVGSLSAISTAGSIIGTFLSGFYLIPYFGTNKLLIIISLLLCLVSLMISSKKKLQFKLFFLLILIIILFLFNKFDFLLYKNKKIIDIDTIYNRIWIYDKKDLNTDNPVRIMGINNENHSSMFLYNDELVNEYTKYYNLAKHFNPNFKTTLMIGGAGYSYPKDFLSRYKDATMDVIEIDPMVTELAKKYFRLKDDLRLNIYHEDGRVYLNKIKQKYDVIFGDAFSSHYSIPYQLTTKETVQKKFDILNNNGIVILNIISSINGEKGKFLRAEYATYKSVFPQVYIFPVKYPNNGNEVQNIILIALKSNEKPIFNNIDPFLNEYLKHLWNKDITMDIPILLDDFAPVDFYINKII